MEIKKINVFKRIFWSWKKIVEYISPVQDNSSDQDNKLITEHINLLKEKINSQEKINASLSNEISYLKNLKFENDVLKEQNQKNESKNDTLNNQLNNLTHERDKLEKGINEKLMTLQKIEKTFFGSTGNKGIGELGERQVKSILEKSGLPKELWTENLLVGNSHVEFAVKSGDEKKWIPVDAKTLTPEIDPDNNKAIIDKNYSKKVVSAAKEMTKYLNKSNTTGYGVLVLQSDDIYMKLFETQPELFQEINRDCKINVASPSSFVQMAWSISYIIDVYENIRQDEKIYDEMISIVQNVSKFAGSLQEAHKHFNIAINSHFPSLENKFNKISKKLSKKGKIKEIKELHFSSKTQDN